MNVKFNVSNILMILKIEKTRKISQHSSQGYPLSVIG